VRDQSSYDGAESCSHWESGRQRQFCVKIRRVERGTGEDHGVRLVGRRPYVAASRQPWRRGMTCLM
jgi:hypothetical protein